MATEQDLIDQIVSLMKYQNQVFQQQLSEFHNYKHLITGTRRPVNDQQNFQRAPKTTFEDKFLLMLDTKKCVRRPKMKEFVQLMESAGTDAERLLIISGLRSTATSDSERFNECAYLGALGHVSTWLKSACTAMFQQKEEKPNKTPEAEVANGILDLLNNNLQVSSQTQMQKLVKCKLPRTVKKFTTAQLKEKKQTLPDRIVAKNDSLLKKFYDAVKKFPVKKKTANEASKTSSAQKEASKSAVVQKGPEKAQKRKLVDSSDPINTKKKKTEKEARKASSARKEASKSAVVQKGPEKTQKRKLVDSSDPNKKTEKEVRKASSARKEASKPAVVQKGPEKAQKRKLTDSSDPINSKSKQVEKEVRKASSAQKETSKPAVVQKGPEKAQERKLADSSDPASKRPKKMDFSKMGVPANSENKLKSPASKSKTPTSATESRPTNAVRQKPKAPSKATSVVKKESPTPKIALKSAEASPSKPSTGASNSMPASSFSKPRGMISFKERQRRKREQQRIENEKMKRANTNKKPKKTVRWAAELEKVKLIPRRGKKSLKGGSFQERQKREKQKEKESILAEKARSRSKRRVKHELEIEWSRPTSNVPKQQHQEWENQHQQKTPEWEHIQHYMQQTRKATPYTNLATVRPNPIDPQVVQNKPAQRNRPALIPVTLAEAKETKRIQAIKCYEDAAACLASGALGDAKQHADKGLSLNPSDRKLQEIQLKIQDRQTMLDAPARFRDFGPPEPYAHPYGHGPPHEANWRQADFRYPPRMDPYPPTRRDHDWRR